MHFQVSSTLRTPSRLVSMSIVIILASACSSGGPMGVNDLPSSRAKDLTFTGQTTITANPAAMTVALTVTNTSTSPVEVPGGLCPSAGFFALYQDTVQSSSPAWTYPGAVCAAIFPNPKTLAPGQSQTYSATYPTGNTFQDGSPPSAGTYFVRTLVPLLDDTARVNAGTVTFPL